MTQEATSPAQGLKLETRTTPEATIILCTGKINSETSALLHRSVQPLIPESKRIVLDLTQVNYIDSSGIGMLVRLWYSTKKADCAFGVVNLSERIKDMLRISHLSTMLEGDHEFHKYLQ
jgi:anti-sigma B factor antagonist